ncbi:uncharacterized protein TNCV_1469111 [Trichonephila clavipes]|nr:uncharacterized protein TNCV_1469111 [Trichonephila clavipes]
MNPSPEQLKNLREEEAILVKSVEAHSSPIGVLKIDLAVRRCWDQWTKETSFTRRPGSERPLQTSLREDPQIIQHARVEPIASFAAIQTHTTPSLRPLCLLEPLLGAWLKDIWYHGVHYVCCQWHPATDTSIESGVTHDEIGLQRNGTRSSSAMNLDSTRAAMTIVFVSGSPAMNASILPSLNSHTPLLQLVLWYGVPLLTIHSHP